MALTGTGAIITQSEFNTKTGIAPFTDTNTTNKCVIKSDIINLQPTYFTFNNNSSYTDTQAVKASDIEMKKRTVTIVVKDDSNDAASVTKTFRYSGIGMTGSTDRAGFVSLNNFTSKTFKNGSQTYTTEVDIHNRLCIDLTNTTKYAACVYCETSQISINHMYLNYTAMDYSTTTGNTTTYSFLNIPLESNTTYVYIYLCKRSTVTNSYNLNLSVTVHSGDTAVFASTYNKVVIKGLKLDNRELLQFEIPLTTTTKEETTTGGLLMSRTIGTGTYALSNNIPYNMGYAVDTTNVVATLYYKVRDTATTWQTTDLSLAIGTSPLGTGDKIYIDSFAGYLTNKGCSNKTVNVSCFGGLIRPIFTYIIFEPNGKWITSSKNPNTSQYTAYESSSNVGAPNSMALGYIKCQGYTTITVYIRSNGESSYDYTIISKPNQSLPTSWSSSIATNSAVQAHTRGAQQASWNALSYWTAVTYTGLTKDTETTIEIAYGKDGTQNSGTDKGYLLIPGGSTVSNYFAISVIFRYDGLVFGTMRINHSGNMKVYNENNDLLFTGTFTSPHQIQYNHNNDYFDPQTGNRIQGADAVGLGYWIPCTAYPTEVKLTWVITGVTLDYRQTGNGTAVGEALYACNPSSFNKKVLTKANHPECVPLATPTLDDYAQIPGPGSQIWYVVCTVGNGMVL